MISSIVIPKNKTVVFDFEPKKREILKINTYFYSLQLKKNCQNTILSAKWWLGK